MRVMPKIIHDPLNPSEGIELPSIPADEWIAKVCEFVGQDLNKAEIAYAEALGQHYNWTATVVADLIVLNRSAPTLKAQNVLLLEILRVLEWRARHSLNQTATEDGLVNCEILAKARTAITSCEQEGNEKQENCSG